MDLDWVFFLLLLQGFAMASRKLADWIWGPYALEHRLIYLPGVIGGLALAACGHLLWVSTGTDPMYSEAFIRMWLRASFLLFTMLGLLFDVVYLAERFFYGSRR